MREQIGHWEGPSCDGYDFELEVYDIGKMDRRGKHILEYVLRDNGKEIFHGDDFAASPMDSIDGVETAGAILGFLSLQKGDTDAEYFEHYSPEQIIWRDGRAQDLAMWAEELNEDWNLMWSES